MQLIDHFCKGNKTAFGRGAGIQSGVLAGIFGSRGTKPGLELLQKILTGYPSVSAEWLLLGHGSMLKSDTSSAVQQEFTPTHEQWEEVASRLADKLSTDDKIREETIAARAKAYAEAEASTVVYSAVGKPKPERPYDGLLTTRLGITDEEATQLIKGGKIRAWAIGENPRITSYRVSEQAVREFLSKANYVIAGK